MLPDRVSNPGPLTYESGAPPIALRGPADPDQIAPIRVYTVCQFICILYIGHLTHKSEVLGLIPGLATYPELQIRRGIEDNSKIIFLISQHCCCCCCIVVLRPR